MNLLKRKIAILKIKDSTLEYSLIGEGQAILVMHGGHSNCYEEFGYQVLIDHGFSLITPSRPGYGNTSKELGDSIEIACDAYLQLMDHLQIDQIHVLAISSGGPSGIHFAARYPERVLSLLLESAVTKEFLRPSDKEYKMAQILFRPSIEKFTWRLLRLFTNLFPGFIFKQMASSFSILPFQAVHRATTNQDIEAFRQMNNRQHSGKGFFIDLVQTSNSNTRELQAITCPTLIVHSRNDGAVPLEHPWHAHEYISHSQLYLVETWGHLIWIGEGSKEVDTLVIEFLHSFRLN